MELDMVSHISDVFSRSEKLDTSFTLILSRISKTHIRKS